MIERRAIPFAASYVVSSDGRVFSTKYGNERELKPWSLAHEHQALSLRVGGVTVKILVHRLVAVLFLGQPESPSLIVRHLDGDPKNNAASNLAWGTQSSNMNDMVGHGRAGLGHRDRGDDHWSRRQPGRVARGERSGSAKLDEPAVRAIRAELAAGTKKLRLAKAYGVSHHTIRRIAAGETWSHIA